MDYCCPGVRKLGSILKDFIRINIYPELETGICQWVRWGKRGMGGWGEGRLDCIEKTF